MTAAEFLRAAWPVLLTLLLYAVQAAILFVKGDFWYATTYVGYAFANVGLAVVAARALQ